MAPRTRKRTKADADVENTENVVPSEPKSKKENLSKALENAGESQEFVGQIDPDSHFPESNCHVFVQEDGTVYDATLNQVNHLFFFCLSFYNPQLYRQTSETTTISSTFAKS